MLCPDRAICLHLLWLTLLPFAWPRPSAARDCVLVATTAPDQVLVINPDTETVVATLPMAAPRELVQPPGSDRLFVAVADGIAVVDLPSRRVEKTIAIPSPIDLTTSGGGDYLFAIEGPRNALHQIDVASARLVKTYTPPNRFLWGPIGASFDGSVVYGIPSGLGLMQLDLASGSIEELSSEPYGAIAVTHDGSKAYLWRANAGFDVFDLVTRQSQTVAHLQSSLVKTGGPEDHGFALIAAGSPGHGVLLNLDGGSSLDCVHLTADDFTVSPHGVIVASSEYGIAITRDTDLDEVRFIDLGGARVRAISSGSLPGVCDQSGCAGDCDGNQSLAVDELVTGVNVALGTVPLAQCRAFDTYADQEVSVDELIAAIHAGLEGCGLELRQFIDLTPPVALEGGADPLFGDMDSDGRLDLLGVRGQQVSVHLTQADGSFVTRRTPLHFHPATEGYFSVRAAVADFDGDGRMDLVTHGMDPSVRFIFDFKLGRGDGSFDESVSIGGTTAKYYTRIWSDDADGDGIDDLVLGSTGHSGEIWTIAGSQLTRLGREDLLPPVVPRLSTMLADLNGDGLEDRIEMKENWLSISRGLAANFYGHRQATRMPWAFRGILAADFNLDGVVDLGLYNPGAIGVLFGRRDP